MSDVAGKASENLLNTNQVRKPDHISSVDQNVNIVPLSGGPSSRVRNSDPTPGFQGTKPQQNTMYTIIGVAVIVMVAVISAFAGESCTKKKLQRKKSGRLNKKSDKMRIPNSTKSSHIKHPMRSESSVSTITDGDSIENSLESSDSTLTSNFGEMSIGTSPIDNLDKINNLNDVHEGVDEIGNLDFFSQNDELQHIMAINRAHTFHAPKSSSLNTGVVHGDNLTRHGFIHRSGTFDMAGGNSRAGRVSGLDQDHVEVDDFVQDDSRALEFGQNDGPCNVGAIGCVRGNVGVVGFVQGDVGVSRFVRDGTPDEQFCQGEDCVTLDTTLDLTHTDEYTFSLNRDDEHQDENTLETGYINDTAKILNEAKDDAGAMLESTSSYIINLVKSFH
uniref:Uncharacterized protein n=1 Tax=Corethron hystrix TaxID=216773 RepID=A0A7S1BET5_9STRA|mmetsp:Transcript_25186/g.58200  ORF Transcript_25186/g.58200 Transcript_25186/m.58200 type:complete len:389 (+) Transcript_25186:79-1245(+)